MNESIYVAPIRQSPQRHKPQPDMLVLNLPTLEGWKAKDWSR